MSVGLALFGSLAEPEECLFGVLRNAGACRIAVSEKELAVGIPLFGSLAVPDDRLFVVLRNAFARRISVAE